MPNPATLQMGDQSPPQMGAESAVALRPFVHGATEVHQPGDDRSTQIAASSTRVGPVSISALGFLRYIVLEVEATGGVESGSSVVAHADAPWSVLADVSLRDTNGRPLFGPCSGYELYLVNKWGGLGINQGLYDPASLQSFTNIATDDPNFTFKLRIPVEITSRDALGSVANQNDASTFKLFYTIADETAVYDTSPDTTLPTVRVRASSEAWSQPRAVGPDGLPQATVPPGLGTTQFWSVASYNVSAGSQRIKFDRMGNIVRNLILVYYDDSSPADRSTTEFPAEWRLEWDNRIIDEVRRNVFLDRMHERYGQSPDTGVFVYDFTHDADGRPGNENRNGYLFTTSGTKFSFIGTFSGSGGILYVMTNDIAPAGPAPASGAAN